MTSTVGLVMEHKKMRQSTQNNESLAGVDLLEQGRVGHLVRYLVPVDGSNLFLVTRFRHMLEGGFEGTDLLYFCLLSFYVFFCGRLFALSLPSTVSVFATLSKGKPLQTLNKAELFIKESENERWEKSIFPKMFK